MCEPSFVSSAPSPFAVGFKVTDHFPPLTVASYDFAESRESVITTDFTPILSETVPLSVTLSFFAFSGYDEIATVGAVESIITSSIVVSEEFPTVSSATTLIEAKPSESGVTETVPV